MENPKKRSTSNSIPLLIAKEMTKAFNDNQGNGKDYTKAVWFPIKQIGDMVDKLNGENADGLRIYFGRYTKDIIKKLNQGIDPEDQIPPTYENRNTVIFVSTKTENGVERIEYYEEYYSIIPENRGILCPPDTGCDPNSELA